MNKINLLKNSSLITAYEENEDADINKIGKSNIKLEKILCNHCGRTSENGIRCLGICVADNDY